ncbi:long-chain-fatty-acid-- ligase isoform 1 [Schistosoma japonicum]|uniref:Long-chain-fatty-acid--ligase isoform 1 n=1 Tax=Schistosoma japonicum TaxID=6182 RepID=A0A4Z2DV11_SCHJA|nr:long-chain-fatty-acid-- ligase isoform 1 [Schistosoma japonicum]
MPRQAEPVSSEDQTPRGGTCKLPDTESHVGCTSLKEGKKSKHSKRSSQTSHIDNKEKAVKTKHTKSKNESSAHIGSKYHSDATQSISANKGPEKEIILDKNKREHVKKKRKHSKGETRHEKRSKHDEPNSEVINDHSLIKESVHKHKRRDKPHGSSKTSTVDKITHRSTTASVIYEDNCQDASISVKEHRFEGASHGYTYEAVPGTPSSASICSSHISRSSYSRSPIQPGKHERRRIHDPHVYAKSHKHRFERSSKSPSVHSTQEHKHDSTRITNIDHESNLEENYNAMRRTQSSASPPPKTKRYDSSTLSYGYRQSTQRHHFSPNHRSHSKHHAPYRERSRSDSERFESRRISTYRSYDKEHIHSKTYFAKTKPKYHNLDDNPDVHETRYSKNREHRDQHNAKKFTVGSHRRDTRGDIESLSPSPKGSKQCRENYELQQHSARQQLLKLQSDVHPPPVPVRDRRDSYDSGSPSQKSTDNIQACVDSIHRSSHSPPSSILPKDKERKSQASHALYDLLDELMCEDVSDTELTLIIPLSMINTVPSVTVSSCNSESIGISESSDKNNHTSNDNNANSGHLVTEKIEKDESNYQSKLNSNLNLASLEALSTQIKQHMTSPENWDINDLDDPIELDEEYSEHTTDETNADLLNLKKPDDNLYTPWQELIESAGQKISSDTIKSDEHDYVQCVGTFIAGVGHQNIVSVFLNSIFRYTCFSLQN